MFDHLGIVFRDLRMAGAFYRAVLTPLGIRLMEDHTGTDGTGWLVFSTGAAESPFFCGGGGPAKLLDRRARGRPGALAHRLQGAIARCGRRVSQHWPRGGCKEQWQSRSKAGTLLLRFPDRFGRQQYRSRHLRRRLSRYR
jgi:catechol 2,3-dioxygenase-like lactoylglutathione lyase family enzyme